MILINDPLKPEAVNGKNEVTRDFKHGSLRIMG